MELTEDDARAYLVTANRVGELGGWDKARLAALLEQLVGSASGLDAVGFSLADLEDLVAELGRKPEPVADQTRRRRAHAMTGCTSLPDRRGTSVVIAFAAETPP